MVEIRTGTRYEYENETNFRIQIFFCQDRYEYYSDSDPWIQVGYGITNTRLIPINPELDTSTMRLGIRIEVANRRLVLRLC